MSAKDWKGQPKEQMACLFNTNQNEHLRENIEEMSEDEVRIVLYKTVRFAKELQPYKKELMEIRDKWGDLNGIKRVC